MKKKFLAGLATGLLMVGMAGAASAASFDVTDTFTHQTQHLGYLTFRPLVWHPGYTTTDPGQTFSDSGSFSFTNLGIGSSDIITTAHLVLDFGNADNRLLGFQTESWSIWAENGNADIFIGNLTGSNIQHSLTWDLMLTPQILNLIKTGTLTIDLKESTGGTDRIDSYSARLFGNYNPVPEPTTMLLMGAGLVGLAGLGRKKKA